LQKWNLVSFLFMFWMSKICHERRASFDNTGDSVSSETNVSYSAIILVQEKLRDKTVEYFVVPSNNCTCDIAQYHLRLNWPGFSDPITYKLEQSRLFATCDCTETYHANHRKRERCHGIGPNWIRLDLFVGNLTFPQEKPLHFCFQLLIACSWKELPSLEPTPLQQWRNQ
jgi:hypothetical protein